MMGAGALQVLVYLTAVLVLIKPLGWYMAQVYEGRPPILSRVLGPLERGIYRMAGISADQDMDWKVYLFSLFFFNALGIVLLFILQRLQYYLPFNPQHFSAVPIDLAFNTAVSFVTNTDWQAYAGENTLSYFTQTAGLTVQNFLSAGTGMALLMALIRGLRQQESTGLGNFWVDMLRGIMYILLPLALVFSLILTSQGVIQNYKPYLETNAQIIPMGPVASQVAIKQLGSNGGGFFKANSAHPFENPGPLSNFLEMLALVLIPAALCYSFGLMVNDRRQGWAILIAMFLMLIFFMGILLVFEQKMGSMQGKETRLGLVSSGLWTILSTASSNGSLNTILDLLTPISKLIALCLIQSGEVVLGGVGSGLYGILILVILTVFIAGLMVGRTPEYIGKKIELYEIKMAVIAVLIMPLSTLLFTAIAIIKNLGLNPSTHSFTEILYAFSSMTANNGSAFASFNSNTVFYNIVGSLAMLIGRYGLVIPILAIAGSLARKKIIPSSLGTLSTHTPLFIILLISVTMALGALSFFPALALGPIVEAIHVGN